MGERGRRVYLRARSNAKDWSSRQKPPTLLGSSTAAVLGPCRRRWRPTSSLLIVSAANHQRRLFRDRSSCRGHTSPLASWKTSVTLSPSRFFCSTSEATHPSVTSGCQALVPTSYVAAMLASRQAIEGGARDPWIACRSGEMSCPQVRSEVLHWWGKRKNSCNSKRHSVQQQIRTVE